MGKNITCQISRRNYAVIFDEAEVGETDNFGDGRSSISVKMPHVS